jgi:hypothetical protein
VKVVLALASVCVFLLKIDFIHFSRLYLANNSTSERWLA